MEEAELRFSRSFSNRADVTSKSLEYWIDLPGGISSGLIEASHILGGIKGLDMVYFSADDIVRHQIIAEIVNAYEKKT
jgi:phosphate starvation-inducible PhoH-like protein